MKTRIIQLDVHDDVISIRDKMGWTKTPRVLLLWPVRRRGLSLNELDLRLLHRHAVSLGVKLGLVSRDGEIHRLARQLGIPVFKTTGEAQRKIWFSRLPRRPGRRHPKPDLSAMRAEIRAPLMALNQTHRLLAFLSGVLSVIILMLSMLPSAQVIISPVQQEQQVVIPVTASLENSTVFLSGSIPAYQTSMLVEHVQTIPATGSAEVPLGAARGQVVFRNLTDQTVIIPAGTIVRSSAESGFRFRTLQNGAVAAGAGQNAEVQVVAIYPGLAGNLPAGSVQTIEGVLATRLAVDNPQAFTGGSTQSVQAPSVGDRASLREMVMHEMQAMVLQQWAASLPENSLVVKDSLMVLRVLEENYFPDEDEAADFLTVSMQVEFQALYLNGTDLNRLAGMALDANLADGFSAVDRTLHFSAIGVPYVGADGTVRLRLQAERMVRENVSGESALQSILGLPSARAVQRLQDQFRLSEKPVIKTEPVWWQWLPIAPFRITLEVK